MTYYGEIEDVHRQERESHPVPNRVELARQLFDQMTREERVEFLSKLVVDAPDDEPNEP